MESSPRTAEVSWIHREASGVQFYVGSAAPAPVVLLFLKFGTAKKQSLLFCSAKFQNAPFSELNPAFHFVSSQVSVWMVF